MNSLRFSLVVQGGKIKVFCGYMNVKYPLNPFPRSYDNSAADDFEHILTKNRKSLELNG